MSVEIQEFNQAEKTSYIQMEEAVSTSMFKYYHMITTTKIKLSEDEIGWSQWWEKGGIWERKS